MRRRHGAARTGALLVPDPSRGDIWLADLDPVRGHEQAGKRPVLVVSVNRFNHGPAGLVIVVPLTSRTKHSSSHVPIEPPEGGVRRSGFAKCEDVRSISADRLKDRWGTVTEATMNAVALRLRVLLGL